MLDVMTTPTWSSVDRSRQIGTPGDTLSPAQAEEATRFLRLALADLAGTLERAVEAAAEVQARTAAAWTMRADQTLGYDSWEAYCDDVLALPAHVSWPLESRQQMARFMRSIGMSYRAIGAVLGADQRTIRRDTAGTPGPLEVQGRDGKTYTRALEAAPVEPPADVVLGEVVGELLLDVAEPDELADSDEPGAPRLSHRDLVVACVRAAGPEGRTSREVGAILGYHHGQSSALCSHLLTLGRLVATGEKRARYRVLVLPTTDA